MDDQGRGAVPPEEGLPPLGEPLRAPAQEAEVWRERHQATYTMIWGTGLHMTDTVPMFPYPHWVAVQTTDDPRYRSEGRLRGGERHCYFCCTLEGEGMFSDQQGSYRLAAGQAFLMKINDPRFAYFYPPDARTPWRFLALTFEGLAAHVMVNALTARHGARYALDPQAPILRRLLACGSQAQGVRIHYLSAAEGAALVLDLLTTLADAADTAEDIGPEAALVRRAVRIIGARAMDGLRVAELAADLGVSREHLTRAFGRQLRQSPSQAIRAQKMRHARFLLRETELPVLQIAAALGYPDVTNFIHAFRQENGATPHQFRRHGVSPPVSAAAAAVE